MLFKDSEKEELRRLVKACMLHISKLEIELEKCEKKRDKIQELNELKEELTKKENHIKKLEESLKEKDDVIKNLNKVLSDKELEISKLKEIKEYCQKLTAKPEKDLTSFQSQIYRVLPSEKSTTEDLHSCIQEIGFRDLKYENMLQILRNLERKGYFRSYREKNNILWEKLEK